MCGWVWCGVRGGGVCVCVMGWCVGVWCVCVVCVQCMCAVWVVCVHVYSLYINKYIYIYMYDLCKHSHVCVYMSYTDIHTLSYCLTHGHSADSHCEQLVKSGITEQLVATLREQTGGGDSEGNPTLLHAAFSAIRNLAIPGEKPCLGGPFRENFFLLFLHNWEAYRVMWDTVAWC